MMKRENSLDKNPNIIMTHKNNYQFSKNIYLNLLTNQLYFS